MDETTDLMNKEAYGMAGGDKCCERRSNTEAWSGVVKAGALLPLIRSCYLSTDWKEGRQWDPVAFQEEGSSRQRPWAGSCLECLMNSEELSVVRAHQEKAKV